MRASGVRDVDLDRARSERRSLRLGSGRFPLTRRRARIDFRPAPDERHTIELAALRGMAEESSAMRSP